MKISNDMLYLLFIMIAQLILLFTKYRKYSIVLILVSCIIFFITKLDAIYHFALMQIIIYYGYFLCRLIYQKIKKRRMNKNIDKMKIKDL